MNELVEWSGTWTWRDTCDCWKNREMGAEYIISIVGREYHRHGGRGGDNEQEIKVLRETYIQTQLNERRTLIK